MPSAEFGEFFMRTAFGSEDADRFQAPSCGKPGRIRGRCGSNSVGRVPAFQAGGRGFESRLPLQYNTFKNAFQRGCATATSLLHYAIGNTLA